MERMPRILVLCLMLFLLCFPSEPVAATSWTILGQHTIMPGDTLFCIGRAYGVDPWAIATQNRILKGNMIHPGSVLAIPNAPASLPAGPTCVAQFGAVPAINCQQCACRQQHLVVTGDTLTQIYRHYGVAVKTIAECNCILDLNYIRIGDSLCIP